MNDLKIILRIKNNLILKKAEEIFGPGLTQGEIENRIGLHQGQMAEFLNFKSNPLKPIKKDREIIGWEWKKIPKIIAIALNVEPEEIFPEHLQQSRQNKYEIQLNSQSLLETFSISPEELFQKKELKENINSILLTLSPREANILKLRFGIGGNEEYTLEEIADEYGISRDRIRQIEVKALRKLRHYSRSKLLT